jgi:hypothetical protein
LIPIVLRLFTTVIAKEIKFRMLRVRLTAFLALKALRDIERSLRDSVGAYSRAIVPIVVRHWTTSLDTDITRHYFIW